MSKWGSGNFPYTMFWDIIYYYINWETYENVEICSFWNLKSYKICSILFFFKEFLPRDYIKDFLSKSSLIITSQQNFLYYLNLAKSTKFHDFSIIYILSFVFGIFSDICDFNAHIFIRIVTFMCFWISSLFMTSKFDLYNSHRAYKDIY